MTITLSSGGKVVTGEKFSEMIKEFRGQFKGLMYSPKEIKSIMMYAGAVGGRVFIDVFLPKRFDTSYASFLGYFSTDEYDSWKQRNAGRVVSFGDYAGGGLKTNSFTMASPQPSPFYASGQSKKIALESAYVQVVATKLELRIRVKCNSAAINFTQQYKAFSKVLESEKQRVAKEVDRVLRKTLLPDAKEAAAAGDRLPTLVTRYNNAWGKMQMRELNQSFQARAI